MKYFNFLFIALTFLVLSSVEANADTWVNGYTKSNGTYVSGHFRSSPNNTRSDNWSSQGNVNPYTGRVGTRSSSSFGSTKPRNSYGNNNRRFLAPASPYGY